jgi:hypothetical protein
VALEGRVPRSRHHGPGFEADAGNKLRLAGAGVLAVQLRERPLDRELRPHGALSVVLLRDRMPNNAIRPSPDFLATLPSISVTGVEAASRISANQVAPFLGIEPSAARPPRKSFRFCIALR